MQLGEHAAVQGLEPPPLGGGEIVWQAQLAQIDQGVAQMHEPLLQHLRTRRDGGGRLGPHQPQRCTQKVAAILLVGGAVGIHQDLGLAGA